MTPQLVDLNADGYNDMIMGIFDGCVHIVEGSADGFKPKRNILDKSGEFVRISMYWDFDESTYLYVDRSIEGEDYIKEHHLTSALAVDWDNDEDLDLLLGAYEGALYLCRNEGTKEKPEFSDKNTYVRAEGEHITLKEGLATPHVCDWNGDGRFDLLCGGSKGGVFYYENSGFDEKTGEPNFKQAIALISPDVGKEPRYEPAFPNNGFHIETVDYDNDGDLDLLLGAQSQVKAKPVKLTDAEEKELAELDIKRAEVLKKLQSFMDGDQTPEEMKEVSQSDEFQAVQKDYGQMSQRLSELRAFPETRNIVWLFRNKAKTENASTGAKSTFTKSKP